MDSGIRLLNNRGQKVIGSTPVESTRIFFFQATFVSDWKNIFLYRPFPSFKPFHFVLKMSLIVCMRIKRNRFHNNGLATRKWPDKWYQSFLI